MATPTMDPGFAGMKADAGDDRVESYPVGAADVGFGRVVSTSVDDVLVQGAGPSIRGISLHSHAIPGPVYKQFDCASVMTKGLVWARVTTSGAVTKDGPVKFGSDGTVSDGGLNLLANAMFRSAKVATADGDIAIVELHAPFSETT